MYLTVLKQNAQYNFRKKMFIYIYIYMNKSTNKKQRFTEHMKVEETRHMGFMSIK